MTGDRRDGSGNGSAHQPPVAEPPAGPGPADAPAPPPPPRPWRAADVVVLAAGPAVALAVAVVVLVVLRWPDRAPGGGAVGGLDASIARSLEADLLMSVTTWVEYVATLVVMGGSVFRLFVSRPTFTGRGRPEQVLVAAAVAGAVACLGSVPLRAMAVSGRGLGAAVDGDVLGVVATSRFADAACLRLVALALFALTLARPPQGWERRVRMIRPGATVLVFGSIPARTVERIVCVVATLVALASFSAVGHPQASEPRALLIVSQATHVLAAAVWFGGGVMLALEVGRQRRWGSARCTAVTVARFSSAAGGALVLVALSGSALAWSQLATPRALVSSAYGRALVAKLVLVAVVVALGAYNHHRLVPAIVDPGLGDDGEDGRAWRRLARTAGVEAVVMGMGVLVATAAMTSGGI